MNIMHEKCINIQKKEKFPSFFLQQARKYMLKCSKITEMDREIYHALHGVHLVAKM